MNERLVIVARSVIHPDRADHRHVASPGVRGRLCPEVPNSLFNQLR